ncbi:MAG: UDP-N-acetylmuramoyl-L-alanyl-D-glutamate--2,6-diaminopimelate ligase [Polyangiales bacterium]
MTSAKAASQGAPLSTIALELGLDAGSAHLLGDATTHIHDVQQDSRRVKAGDLFVSREGSASGKVLADRDSSAQSAASQRFLAEALSRGAAAVMCAYGAHALEVRTPVLEVPASALRGAIGVAASVVHGHPSFKLDVIGVTGTNGKTTTTSLLADAFDHIKGQPDCAVIGTIGARFGARKVATTHTTPEADEIARLLVFARDEGATRVAMEVSSHALDQQRLHGTRLRAAAFTNLTQDHLDYHGTMDGYFNAKRRLFDELRPGVAVICVDDEYGKKLASTVTVPLLRVACESMARELMPRPQGLSGAPFLGDVRVVRAAFDASGVVATVATPRGEVSLRSALLGRHNLSNLVLALGVLVALDIDPSVASEALGAAGPVAGRLALVTDPARDDIMVLVDYAHTPDALTRALSTLQPLTVRETNRPASAPSTARLANHLTKNHLTKDDARPRARLLCVFGCGGDRDPTKRAKMGEAVSLGADIAVVTSDNPRSEHPQTIVDAIVEGMIGAPRLTASDLRDATAGVHIEVDRRAAIARAIAAAKPGDVVLIAGKGHENYQIVGSAKLPFDDAAEARAALALRLRALTEGG